METFKVIFKAGETKGVYGISLVESPATDAMFIALSKDENKISLKAIDNEKRILCGAVLIPDKPIYRKQNDKEFNIVFPAETIRLSMENFFEQSYHKNSTLEHNENLKLSDVVFIESWIKEDAEKDKSVMLGFDEPVGTWFASMKVNNDEIWNEFVKTGKVAGFSIDGLFDLEKINLNNDKMDLKQIVDAIKEGFASKKEVEKVDLGKVMTKDQNVTIEFEGDELVAGLALTIKDGEGNSLPLPDGEYLLDNDMVLTVEGGMAKEMKAKEVEADLNDDPAKQAPSSPAVKSEKVTQEVFYQLAKAMGSEMAKINAQLNADLKSMKDDILKEIKEEAISLTKQKGEKAKSYEEMTPLEKRRFNRLN